MWPEGIKASEIYGRIENVATIDQSALQSRFLPVIYQGVSRNLPNLWPVHAVDCYFMLSPWTSDIYIYIQGVSGEIENILGGGSMDYSE